MIAIFLVFSQLLHESFVRVDVSFRSDKLERLSDCQVLLPHQVCENHGRTSADSCHTVDQNSPPAKPAVINELIGALEVIHEVLVR